MTEPTQPPAGSARCPWCSTPLEDPAAARCSACGAQLVGDEVASVPGVTAIDAEAILQARSEAAGTRGRSRFLGWLGGDAPPPSRSGSEASLAPPSREVRREMLRLEIAAAEAEIKGELQARLVEMELERSEAAGDAAPAAGDGDASASDPPAPA